MEIPCIVFVTLMVFYMMVTPTTGQICDIETCQPDCERSKCIANNGTCMPDTFDNEVECFDEFHGWWVGEGRGKWCKYYRKCKCCVLPFCDPTCIHGYCKITSFVCVAGVCVATTECVCEPGWNGPRCDTPICDPNCENGGTCSAPDTCDCAPGWTGEICEIPMCIPPCENGGTCIAPDTCECPEGWTGPVCETPICSPPCQNGGTCIAPDSCDCAPGWTGDICETPMCNPPCDNGGSCIEPDTCECTPEWTGSICETPVCEPPCLNGGTCIAPNDCDCTGTGFTGTFCEFIDCTERENCIAKSGTCYDKLDPIFNNTQLCPNKDNGRKWCSPMCACCFP